MAFCALFVTHSQILSCDEVKNLDPRGRNNSFSPYQTFPRTSKRIQEIRGREQSDIYFLAFCIVSLWIGQSFSQRSV